ncbi:MAG: hypothetical protein FWD72_05190, partial [Eggerthellaceae bacterium]|nr:hypothetical protein [Eggerthellaceae bacterium]
DAVQDVETAHALAGCFCLAKKEDLPDVPEGAEGREAGIDGFDVFDERFGDIGRVMEVLDNPGQRLICVTGEEGSFSIPFVDEFVKRIDREGARVEVRIPAGLLGLATKPSQERTEAGVGHED